MMSFHRSKHTRGCRAGVAAALLLCAAALSSPAAVDPARVFADRMVIQRDRPIEVFGTADANTWVSVEFGGNTETTTADGSGNWSVTLPAMSAGGPYSMVIRGEGGVYKSYDNVYVGEVWVCSGQSNMVFPIKGRWQVPNADAVIAAANYPLIRESNGYSWIACSPGTAADFSAVAYFFARELHTELDVPVGILRLAANATSIGNWRPGGTQFESKMRHILGYGIRGFVWYQGETDCLNGNAAAYGGWLQSLIGEWRTLWLAEDGPFAIVQVAPYNGYGGDLTTLWQSQMSALAMTNTGYAVTTDVGELDEIHPQRKQEVGERCAYWALANVYGRTDLAWSGPVVKDASVTDGRVSVTFDHVHSGLTVSNGTAPNWFQLAGADGVFKSATAEIAGDRVLLSSSQVPTPEKVRFGWADTAQPNLFNADGIPARPFGPIAMGPNLLYVSSDMDDGAGNGDGVLNPGETVDVTPTIRNAGVVGALSVTGTVRIADAYATVTGSTLSFGNVAAGASAAAPTPFVLAVSNDCPIPHTISFSLLLEGGNADPVSNAFALTVYESTTISGRVTDAETALGLAGATVEYDGPTEGGVTTDGSGDYSFPAVNGNYAVRARKAGYEPAAPTNAAVPPAATVNLELGAPEWSLVPSSMTVTVQKTQSGAADLVVSNAGNRPLTCSLWVAEGAETGGTGACAPYWWEDIEGESTAITALDGDASLSGAIALGFSFPYYGQTYSSLYVSANGWVSFASPAESLPNNLELPDATASNVAIALFWDDLDFGDGGSASYAVRNGDTFILTFDRVAIDSRAATVSAQLILDASGRIECRYAHVGYATSATVGLQSPSGDRGYTAAFNGTGQSLTNRLALRLYPGRGGNWLSVSETSLAVAVGESETVSLQADAAGLMVGDYDTVLLLAGNDPAQTQAAYPVRLAVVGNPANQAPVASNALYEIDEDAQLPDTRFALPAHDADGDPLVLTIVDLPDHGSLVETGTLEVVYTPQANFFGTDSFTYKVNDLEEDSATATGTIQVASVPDVPQVAWVGPADGSTYLNGSTIAFEATASDDDGNDTLAGVTFRDEDTGDLGTDPYDGDTAYRWETVLAAGTYTVFAVAQDAGGLAATSAAVTVEVQANQPPAADAGADRTVNAGVAAELDGSGTTDTDNDLAELTWVWDQTAGPAVTLSGADTMTAAFTPSESGDHAFRLRVSDGQYWSTDTVTYAVNVLPTAHDQSLSTPEATPLAITLTCDDPDGPGPLVYTVIEGPDHGGLSGVSPNLTYTPDDGFRGRSDAFQFVAEDGIGTSATATVTIQVDDPTGTNRLRYVESFESYQPGATLIDRNGWYAESISNALISTNADVLAALLNDYGGTLPLTTNHTRILRIVQPATNRVSSADLPGEAVRIDMMVRPHRTEPGKWHIPPPDHHVAVCFDTDGRLAAYLRPAPGADAGWHVLTNAPAVAQDAWVRLRATVDYSSSPLYFSLRLDDGEPLTDAVGTARNGDDARQWFLSAKDTADHMSEIIFKGKSWIDDFVAEKATDAPLPAREGTLMLVR